MNAMRNPAGWPRRVLAWLARGTLVLTALLAASVLMGWGWTQIQINRPTQSLTQEEARQSYLRAVGWLRSNESLVLSQGNAALWWMIDTAARRSEDRYLAELVERHLAIAYRGMWVNSPWKRLVRPQAAATGEPPAGEQLVRYQRFFLTAVTCQADADTIDFLEGHVCRPSLIKALLVDRVCSTHHLMGLMIHRRSGCEAPAGVNRLHSELLDDIETQARLDPFMRDATLQRVLMLAWAGAVDRPQPSWVRRVRDAQQADGGWSGEETLPEWADFLQPRALAALWARLSGRPLPRSVPPSDFHASAQGLLLMALLAHPAGKIDTPGQ